MSWRGVFSGVLLLAGLQAVVSSSGSADRFGGLVLGIRSIVDHALSPFEPAIPDLRNRQATPPPPTPPPPGHWRRGGARPDAPAVPGQGTSSGVLA